MFVKKIIAVCLTALLITGGTLYTFGNFGAAIYHVEMKKVEVEQMKVMRDVVKNLPPEALVPQPRQQQKPSVEVPGGEVQRLDYVAPIHATPTPEPALDTTDSKVILNEGDGKTVLSDYDGKEVLDGKTVLPFNDKVVLDDTPPVAIDLPKLPPNDFIPHIPETSP